MDWRVCTCFVGGVDCLMWSGNCVPFDVVLVSDTVAYLSDTTSDVFFVPLCVTLCTGHSVVFVQCS